jgi:small-conductance mechanosensitive channel
MKKNTLLATMFVAIIIAALVGYLLAIFFLPPPDGAPPLPPPEEMQLMVTLKTMLSFVNLVLIVPLLIIYVKIYRDVQSKFTSGLIVVILFTFSLDTIHLDLVHSRYYRMHSLP